jgi:hypothetical protein
MYFERMRELSENMNISQRIRFMLRVSLVYDRVFFPDRLFM